MYLGAARREQFGPSPEVRQVEQLRRWHLRAVTEQALPPRRAHGKQGVKKSIRARRTFYHPAWRLCASEQKIPGWKISLPKVARHLHPAWQLMNSRYFGARVLLDDIKNGRGAVLGPRPGAGNGRGCTAARRPARARFDGGCQSDYRA